MNTKSIIEIFRGDDSDALGYQTIVGTIHTDLDLTGCKAVFRYLGFFQEFDPIPEDGKLTIVIPSASSMQFPPGFGYASLKVYDIDRKVRTFTNRIPVFVKTMTPCRGGGEFDVEFSPFPELEPLKIFVGPNADDFDQYTGFISKIIDRASLAKYGLVILADAMSEDGGATGKAASPAAVKAAYDAVIGVLADNYYTAEQTDEAIDRVAAYYITYDAAGNPFPTYASLANATTVYSGGSVRVPTRNDYCVVLADETHQGAEYRYIYAVAEGQTTGSWQAQFPVEGVMTVDQTVQKNSQNPVSGGGVWSAIWGMATTAFSSLYDWVVDQLSLKADKTYVDAKSSIKSPDGDTVVSANNDGTAKVTKTTHTLGNPTVTFPALYNIRYYDISWGSEYGITMEFVGPVPSSVPYAPNDEFYYYSVLGTFDSYDPSQYDAWCIWVSGGRKHLMYKTGPFYDIDDFDSASPSLTLNQGEVMGEPPVMTRTDSSSSTTKTVATMDQIPTVPTPYTSSPNMDGSASAGSSNKFSRGDHRHPSDTSRVPTSRTINGKALSSDVTLTGADMPVDATQGATKINAALAGKASTADATLNLRGPNHDGFSAWEITWVNPYYPDPIDGVTWHDGNWYLTVNGQAEVNTAISDRNAVSIDVPAAKATRTALQGYQLGPDEQTNPNRDKPLASEAEAEALRTGKQSKITASGILKGDGAGGISAATAGTDYQAPLGFTPENASNKVTSLTAQSTDTQYPSAKCVYDAIQGVDVKPTRIYNEAETDALDDKGQLFKSSLQGNYWTVGTQQYNYVGPSGNEYIWQISSSDKISYNKNTGVIQERRTLGGVNYSYDRGTVTTGLNPANGDTIPSLPGVQFHYGNGATFTPLAPTMDTSPYAHFALESLPDRTWAAGVWAVGDLVKYDGKAYRCKSATTAGDTTAPSSDTTHWTEIPVLSQKQDALSQSQLANIAAVSDALAFDATHTYAAGDPVVYNGTLYTFTAAHTGAWTGSDVSAVDIIARLAGKLDKSGGELTGLLYFEDAFLDNRDGTICYNDGTLIKLEDMALWDPASMSSGSKRWRMEVTHYDQGQYSSSMEEIATLNDVGDLARYALVTKTISNGAVSLDDRADNYVDARALGSSDSLDIDFPTLVDGKARDFVLAVECGANPPTISYAAFVTIMAEDASSLTPEEGMNIYAFTEFKPNMFLASRKTVDTVVVNTPESGDQLMLAMQGRGIDTTGITSFGGVETALGLGDTDTPQDAVDAVMN